MAEPRPVVAHDLSLRDGRTRVSTEVAARPLPSRRRRWSWRDPGVRALLWQALALAAVGLGLWWLVGNLQANLAARGIRSGFDFLREPAGFDIGESLIAWDAADSYARAYLVGLLNTLRVALPGCAFATLWGALIGVGAGSAAPLALAVCRAYVELFRNVPLLVQLLLAYALLLALLPEAEAPLALPGGLWLGKAGLALPGWTHGAETGWSFSWPQPAGFGYEGGWVASPEYLTVLLGLVAYTAAFIAEVVRAGLTAVPRGQIEAAQSIGLSPWQTLRRVSGPQALRVIVPPLANQYLNLIKNSSLAVAVGYPDVVAVAGTALNQTGRAVECIALVMGVYLSLSLLTAAGMNVWNRRVVWRER